MAHMNNYGKGILSNMFKALMKGKAKHGSSWLPSRRSGHRQRQMKAIGKGRFEGRSSRFGL